MSAIVVGDANYTSFQRKLIELSFENIHKCSSGKSRHVSFMVKKNKILVIGVNHESKSHTLAHRFNFYHNCIHSELHAISRFPRHAAKYCDASLYNVRINRYNEIKLSKPCANCQNMLAAFNIRDIYYTDDDGSFKRF